MANPTVCLAVPRSVYIMRIHPGEYVIITYGYEYVILVNILIANLCALAYVFFIFMFIFFFFHF